MSGQATRTAPAARLGERRLLDSLATRLGGGADTNLAADILKITGVSRLDPQRLQIKQADGTKYVLTVERQ